MKIVRGEIKQVRVKSLIGHKGVLHRCQTHGIADVVRQAGKLLVGVTLQLQIRLADHDTGIRNDRWIGDRNHRGHPVERQTVILPSHRCFVRTSFQAHHHGIDTIGWSERDCKIGGAERGPVGCDGLIDEEGAITRNSRLDVQLHIGTGGVHIGIRRFNRELNHVWIKPVLIIRQNRVAIAVQFTARMAVIAKPIPLPRIRQAIVVGIFIHRIMVAEVRQTVIVGQTAILRGIGRHALKGSQQIGSDASGASIAKWAAGSQVVIGIATGLKDRQ